MVHVTSYAAKVKTRKGLPLEARKLLVWCYFIPNLSKESVQVRQSVLKS
jgi:hypothetical protein